MSSARETFSTDTLEATDSVVTLSLDITGVTSDCTLVYIYQTHTHTCLVSSLVLCQLGSSYTSRQLIGEICDVCCVWPVNTVQSHPHTHVNEVTLLTTCVVPFSVIQPIHIIRHSMPSSSLKMFVCSFISSMQCGTHSPACHSLTSTDCSLPSRPLCLRASAWRYDHVTHLFVDLQ